MSLSSESPLEMQYTINLYLSMTDLGGWEHCWLPVSVVRWWCGCAGISQWGAARANALEEAVAAHACRMSASQPG
jgi:hypothetical protein